MEGLVRGGFETWNKAYPPPIHTPDNPEAPDTGFGVSL
jgi:hypothetical protein